MQLRQDVTLKAVCGQNFITYHTGHKTRVIRFNDTASFVWNKFRNVPSFTYEDVARSLIDEYDIDAEMAASDSHYIIDQWNDAGLVV